MHRSGEHRHQEGLRRALRTVYQALRVFDPAGYPGSANPGLGCSPEDSVRWVGSARSVHRPAVHPVDRLAVHPVDRPVAHLDWGYLRWGYPPVCRAHPVSAARWAYRSPPAGNPAEEVLWAAW